MRLTVGKKLNSLLFAMLALGIGGAVWLATELFSSDLVGHIKRELIDSVGLHSNRSRSEFTGLVEKAQVLGALSMEEFKYPEDRIKFLVDSIQTEERIVSLAMWDVAGLDTKESWRIIHKKIQESFPALVSAYPSSLEGKVQLQNSELQSYSFEAAPGLNIFRVFVPLVKNSKGEVTRWVAIDLDQSKTFAMFADSANTTAVLLNTDGMVLASGDPQRFPVGKIPSIHALFSANSSLLKQIEYSDENQKKHLAAYQALGLANLVVLGITPLERVYQAQAKLLRRSSLLGAIFLFIALAAGLIFARTLTGPLEALGSAAERIVDGDFSVRLKMPKKWSGKFFRPDEIKQVIGVFNTMVSGLQEREKMKNLIEKFHSKEVAQKLLSGDFQLGGQKKEAAVLFVDIRSFTTLSETHSPEQIVTLLNLYMTKMVDVIVEHGGVVDKYIGDAIMALWGVPETKENDEENALRACLHIREALPALNRDLEAHGLPAIKIGMGLHYGSLIAGNMGSVSRMEYTAVGDTVNTASRIQDLTKVHSTDLLVSEPLYSKFQSHFNFESVGGNKVRGKKEEMTLYKVSGVAAVKSEAA